MAGNRKIKLAECLKHCVSKKYFFVLAVLGVITFWALAELEAQRPANSNEIEQKKMPGQKKKFDNVKTVSFLLKDGYAVMGRIITEDRRQMTISELGSGKLLLANYLRSQIEPGSLSYRTMSEPAYWQTTAAYFLGKAWDFENDPDDFIQAIQCYQKAKNLVIQHRGPDHELAKQLTEQIEQVRSERELWTEEAQSRAKLKMLELESVLETRLDELRDMVTNNSEELARIRGMLEEPQNFAKVLDEMRQNLNEKIDRSFKEIEVNREEIRYLRYKHGPRYRVWP